MGSGGVGQNGMRLSENEAYLRKGGQALVVAESADIRTAVAQFDDIRFWIHWDLKFVETIPNAKLAAALDKKRFKIIGRLREVHALELQQKLLSNLGRIGLPAMMPATFPVKVEICYLDVHKKAASLPVPGLDAGGVCFMGRELIKQEGKPDKSEDSSRLVLSEPLVDEVLAAVAALDQAVVDVAAHDALRFIKESEDLSLILTKSLKLGGAASRVKIQSVTDTAGNGRTIGFVARNGDRGQVFTNADARKAGVLIFVDDVS